MILNLLTYGSNLTWRFLILDDERGVVVIRFPYILSMGVFLDLERRWLDI